MMKLLHKELKSQRYLEAQKIIYQFVQISLRIDKNQKNKSVLKSTGFLFLPPQSWGVAGYLPELAAKVGLLGIANFFRYG